MRSFLLVLAGAGVACLMVLMGWIASTDCPPNRLILSVSLPTHLNAEVFIRDLRIWSGSRNATEEISFPMGTGEGQFLVRISNGMEVSTGYVERADGRDHILFISESMVSYGSLDRGLAEFLRRNAACPGK
ncbi:MAG: hypothetical protein AB7G62_00465 [Magnetospirillum sp.]